MIHTSRLSVSVVAAIISFFCFALTTSAAVSSSQVVPLSPGWNIVSTPKLLESHSFSTAETSANFDIYLLDPSGTSGWTTMAGLGQTEFTPLYGYFINNKTGAKQTLVFNYLASTTPSQRLLNRTFSTNGWYSLGIANPTYALPIDAATSTPDQNNARHLLASISDNYDELVDFTDGLFTKDVRSVSANSGWKMLATADQNLFNDFRETKGYAIRISTSGGTLSGFQNDDATPQPPVTPIGTASITISNATEVAPQNISPNVPNQVLGGFKTVVAGEPITVQQMSFSVATSSTGPGRLTLVSILDENGAVIAGPIDASTDGKILTFSNSVTFPIGTHIYTIKGKVPTSFVNAGTIILSTNPSTQWLTATGEISHTAVSLATNALFTMNTMTVRAGVLVLSVSSNPASQTIVAGSQTVLFMIPQFDASQSGEDIRFSSLQVFESGNGDPTALSNCQLSNGSLFLNTGSNIQNSIIAGQNNFTLDNPVIITKGTVGLLTVSCAVASSAVSGSTYRFGFNATGFTTPFTGVSSGNTITPTVATLNAGFMTVASSANVALAVDPSSPSYQVVSAGTTGITDGVYKFRASNEAVNLTKVGLKLSSGSPADITTVYLYNSSGTQIGTATFVGTNTTATSTLSTPFVLGNNLDTLVTVKVDIASIASATPGDLVKIDPLNFEGTGAQSGTTVRGGISGGSVSGLRIFRSSPTFALDTLSSTGVADGRLMRFKITGSSAGSIGIQQFAFSVATTTATVTNAQLFAFTDSSYSQPVSGQGTGGQIGTARSTIPNNATFLITPTANPVQVPAGQTSYFELRASVSGVTTGSSVVSTLKGDGSYSGVAPASGVTGNLIWSGNSISTSAIATSDWSNGFGIPGLPSSGLIQTRSN